MSGFIAVFVTMCHLLSMDADKAVTLCQEVKVIDSNEMLGLTMVQCKTMSQPALADWKANSQFADDDWTIVNITCSDDPSRGVRNDT